MHTNHTRGINQIQNYYIATSTGNNVCSRATGHEDYTQHGMTPAKNETRQNETRQK